MRELREMVQATPSGTVRTPSLSKPPYLAQHRDRLESIATRLIALNDRLYGVLARAAQPFDGDDPGAIEPDTIPAGGWIPGINRQSDKIEQGLGHLESLIAALEQVS